MEVGNKIKALIKGRGLTQSQFADLIDENLTQLNKVLNGDRDPSFELLGKILNEFHEVDLNWLFRNYYQIHDSIPIVNEDGATSNAELLDDIQNIEEILLNMKKKVSQ